MGSGCSSTQAATVAEKNAEGAEVSNDTLRRYYEISAIVAKFERKNVVQRLEEKMQNSIDLKNQASQMNKEYKQLQEKTDKELKDVQDLEKLAAADTIMNYFKDQVSFDTQMSKEQEEYIQAKTEMEDYQKRILALQSQQSKIETKMAELNKDRDEMTKHYEEQDGILESIFKGSYGSELENQLEDELDKEQEYKQKIEVGYERWKNAEVTETVQPIIPVLQLDRIMADQAFHQLSQAYDRWQAILRIPANTRDNKILRLNIADQVRKFIVAASQNLTSIDRTLIKVNKLPYCDMTEVATLNKTKDNIFTDINDKARHSKAGNVYKTTRDRCLWLGKWITHVITGVIQIELDKTRETSKDLQVKLRKERGRLMKNIIEEKTGEKVNLEEASTDSGIDTEIESEVSYKLVATEAEMIPEAQDLDQQIEDAQEDEADGGEAEKVQTPASVSPEELAPAPKQEELFGNLENVMAEYDNDLEKSKKETEASRAKEDADFYRKIRRSNRLKWLIKEQELNELIQKDKDAAAIEVPKK